MAHTTDTETVESPTTDENIRWIEHAIGRTLSADQARCFSVLCSIQRPYNLPLIRNGWSGTAEDDPDHDVDADELPELAPVVVGARSIVVRMHHSLGTFDGAELTRLVLAAHQHAVRVKVRTALYHAVDLDGSITRYDSTAGDWVDTGEHPSGPAACLELLLTPRQRDGDLYQRHPTNDQAIAAAAR